MKSTRQEITRLKSEIEYAVERFDQLDDLLPAANSSGTIARCAAFRLRYTDGCACGAPHSLDDEDLCSCPCHERPNEVKP